MKIFTKENMKNAMAGLCAGLCNGLFGAGGGTVAVLALEKAGLSPRQAHATAISIMLPLSTASAMVYAVGGGVDWHALLWVAPALTGGSALGAKLTGKIQGKTLKLIFGIVMLAAGGWMAL